MPTPRYTNADLARFQRKPLGISFERDRESDLPEGYVPAPSADQLLAEARGSLERADTLGRENNTRALSSLENRLAMLSLPDRRPSLVRQGTDLLDTAAGVTGGMAIPAAMVPGGQAFAAGLGTLSGAMFLPGAVRKMVSPDEDESRLEGAIQAAGSSLGFAPVRAALAKGARGVGSLLGLQKAAPGTALARRPPLGEIVDAEAAYVPRGPIAQGPSSIPTPAQLGPASADRLLGPATSTQTPPPRPLAGLLNAAPEAATSAPPSLAGLQQGATTLAPGASWAGERSRIADRLAGKRPKGRMPKETRGQVGARQVSQADDNPHAIDWETAIAGDPGVQLVESGGLNASGESAASLEAMRRLTGMQQRGEQFVVFDRAGRMRPVPGPEAVDYVARPGETFGVMTPGGFNPLDARGGKVTLK